MTTLDLIATLIAALERNNLDAVTAALDVLEARMPAGELADLLEQLLAATEPPAPPLVPCA